MMERKKEVIQDFTQGIEALFKKNKIDWIKGKGKLTSPHSIDVKEQKIEAKNIVLASGSKPITFPNIPFDEKLILSSTAALSLSSVPKKILIVGAGVIGCELGSIYKRLGSEVVFIEFLDRICPAFDPSLSKALQKALTSQGMEFYTSHKVVRAENTKLIVEGPNEEVSFEGDVVLIAIGRRPYSEGLGLEEVGIEKDRKGFVQIDAFFRTTHPNIFAIGDLVEGPMLAHKASEEGAVVAELIAGSPSQINYIAVPNVAYTHPEVASVGLTEDQIKSRNLQYVSSQFPFKANSRTRCIQDTEGFIKIYAEKSSKKILGVHMIGPSASELIAEATLAIQLGATGEQLADTCYAHPTLSETLKEASLGLFKAPIHI